MRKKKTSSRLAEAIDEIHAARQRALLLTELRYFLQDRFSRRNGQPAERSLLIDGASVPPKADVVENIVGELLVGSTLATQRAEAIKATAVELQAQNLPKLFDE